MATNFNINGIHLEVTPALASYAQSKLCKADKIVHNITTINVILTVDNRDQKAEAEVRIGGDQHIIFAEATTDDMYKSIDYLEDKVLHQVRKYHDELKDHHKGDN